MIQQTSCQLVQRIPGFRLKNPESTADPSPSCGKLNCTQLGEQQWLCTATHWNAPQVLWKPSVHSVLREIICLPRDGSCTGFVFPPVKTLSAFRFAVMSPHFVKEGLRLFVQRQQYASNYHSIFLLAAKTCIRQLEGLDLEFKRRGHSKRDFTLCVRTKHRIWDTVFT